MKVLSGDASDAANESLGQDPIILVKIEWATGTQWYADRDVALHSARGDIINLGALAAEAKEATVGAIGEMSFTMKDDDDHFKTRLDTCCAEGTAATVYQSFASAPEDEDLILLLRGVIISPEWNEGERTFKFGIETKIHDLEVGYAIEQNFYDDFVVDTPLLTDEAIGKMWPLCFGSLVHEPALKLLAPPETSLNGTFKKGDNFFFVEDASRFPIGPIDVIIDGMVFRVTVDKANNKMILQEGNVPKYENIPFGPRDGSDPDSLNPWVAWIDQDISLVNTFIFFTTEFNNDTYHRVIRQEGRKIWLDNKIIQKKPDATRFNTGIAFEPKPMTSPTIIKQAAKNGRDGWGIEMSYVGGATTANGQISVASFRDTVQIISGVTWKFAAGEVVRMWSNPAGSALHPVKYVANAIPSTQVKAVYAWRTLPRTGQRRFKAIPSSYYTVSLNESIFGQHATTITLKTPLADYFGQGWSEQLFVSFKSSVGPNVSDVIKYLLQTYSNISVDATTFNAIKALQTNYPVAIAITSKQNVISICESIAWKARCSLLIEDGLAKLKYLSKEPTSDLTIDEEVVENRSLIMTTTRIEEIVTHFRANWKKDHSGRPHKEYTIVKTENVSQFGLHKREFDFDIYNVQSLVEKSASFWAHRMANSWRFCKLNVLKRTALALEMLDTITVDLDIVGNQKCVLDRHSYDAESDDRTTFGLSLWMPWLAGTTVQDSRAWLSDAGDTLPADPVDQLNETTVDEQWADDLSHSFVNHKPTTRPAKIINASADGFGFNVDIFDNGFEDDEGNDLPATNRDASGVRQEFVAYPIDTAMAIDRQFPTGSVNAGLERYRNILKTGTRIQIFYTHSARWMFNVPADSAHVLGKINGPPQDALGRIGISTYPDGYDGAVDKAEVKAYHAGDVTTAAVGDKVLLFAQGNIKVAVPIGGGSGTAVRCFQIQSRESGADYIGLEYDEPDGTLIGDPLHPTPMTEDNGSIDVPNNQWVRGYPGTTVRDVGDDVDVPVIWFSMPFGCNS